MDPRVLELRIRQWIPVFEEQAKSGLNKDEWCIINGVSRGSFFRWQKRVRSYLLEHGEGVGQLTVPSVNEQTDNECFVELPCTQAAFRNLHDDVMDEAAPISIRYGEFVVNVNDEVDERQLAVVLRALKNAE